MRAGLRGLSGANRFSPSLVLPMNPIAPRSSTSPEIRLACQLLEEGRDAEAVACLEKLPSPAADALHRQIATRNATTALQRKDIAGAIAWLERGLARNPADPTLNFFRGNLHLDSGHVTAAIACFQHCVAAEPEREEYICNLGHALVSAGQAAAATELLAVLPDSATAQFNLGVAYEMVGDAVRAARAYERAGRLRPDCFDAWFNLGQVREQLDDPHATLAAFNRAVAVRPTDAPAHFARGRALQQMRNPADAIVSFDRATRLDPTLHAAGLAAVHARQTLCDWQALTTVRTAVVDPLLTALESGRSVNPFSLLALPAVVRPSELRRAAEIRSSRLAAGTTPSPTRPRIRRDRPLRVGYVSPDFGNHAVGHCVRSLFARHDRNRISVHGFSLVTHPSGDCRESIRGGCDTWDELPGLSDSAAATLIASREVDVLVDLAGHTLHSRLGLFAWRPAPIQVTWLGYPGTTGAPFMDALLADNVVIPPGGEDSFYEPIVRLPGCYLPCDDTQPITAEPQTRAMHGLPETGAVFCAFNNAFKIEPVIFGAWMEILRRVDQAVLWLRGGLAELETNLAREAAVRGIDPARLVFDRKGLPKDQHLARHRVADLYLDTHFYNAHTTAADALWAGLPVLTCPGATFPSRVGASLVTTLGLADELVAATLEDYVERAVRLALEPERRRALTERLATARTGPALFNTTAFARKLEDAYYALAAAPAPGSLPAT